jgi:hypothetical protein
MEHCFQMDQHEKSNLLLVDNDRIKDHLNQMIRFIFIEEN